MKEINISCTPVNGFEEKSKFHVPGYMDLKKKQNIMYRVHGFEEKTKFHVPGGVHEILIFSLFFSVAQVVEDRVFIF